MSAICHRCGGHKQEAFQPCSECGHTPIGQGRLIAWLFSSAHLSSEELKLAADRIRSGEIPEPSSDLLKHAKQQGLRNSPSDLRPLPAPALMGIGLGSLILTPLVGFAVWWGLRYDRPIAAKQALRVTAPIAAATGALWLGVIGLRLLG